MIKSRFLYSAAFIITALFANSASAKTIDLKAAGSSYLTMPPATSIVPLNIVKKYKEADIKEQNAISYANAQKAQTLDDAIAAALANEPEFLANSAMVDVAKSQKDMALANNRSTIGLVGSTGINKAKLGIEPNVPSNYKKIYPHSLAIAWEKKIFDGGAALSQIQEADFNLAAANSELLNKKNQLIIDVVNAYLGLIVANENVQYASDNVEASKKSFDDATKMFNAGEVAVSQKAAAEASYYQAISLLSSSNAQLQAAKSNLMRLTNRGFDNVTIPRGVNISQDMESAREYALKNHPLILAADARYEAAKAKLKSAKANNWPTITASVRASSLKDQFFYNYKSDDYGAYLNFSMPLYDGGRISAGSNMALAGVNAASAQKLATERAVNMGVNTSYSDYNSATSSLAAAKAAVEARKLALKSVQAEMRVGQRPVSDVLDAQRDLTAAQMQLAKANADLIVSRYKILASMGEDLSQ